MCSKRTGSMPRGILGWIEGNIIMSKKPYIVTVYRTLSKRWAFRHPSGYSSNGNWASKAYAIRVAKKLGKDVEVRS